jgi:hypothetical protein
MERRENVEIAPQINLWEVLAGSDLPLRIEKISEQTGLSPLNLLQKWVLQEESLIGLMQHAKAQRTEQGETRLPTSQQQTSAVREQEKPSKIDTESPDYRKVLVKKVKKLQKEGMTLVKIAETFNEENLPTVSGKGKWYSSSITWLLSLKV